MPDSTPGTPAMEPTSALRYSRWFVWLFKLSRKEKLFLVLCALELLNQGLVWVSGFSLPLSTLVDLLFVILAFILGVIYLRRLVRQMLWRLRNRLIVTYVLIGVVPIVLILTMLGISAYFLMGQVATYLVTTELRRHNDMVRDTAYSLGWNVSERIRMGSESAGARNFLEDIQRRFPNLQAVVRTSARIFSVPESVNLPQFPTWSKPGFQGLIQSGRDFALAAHIRAGLEERQVEVFAYEFAEPSLLASLLPGVASIQLMEMGKPLELPQRQTSPFRLASPSESSVPAQPKNSPLPALPRAKGWWDLEVRWGTLREVWVWNGQEFTQSTVAVGVLSRPSLIIQQLFSSLGELAGTIKMVLLSIAGLFLVVEIASLVFGVSLTRSITRSVAELYDATRKIKVGDFSHRIPIRSNDQLSELASSFNNMTENIEKLIVESQEKERLQSELEIAREVQAQLFPKRLPHLRTLELHGICNPARVVSGDYYDCISVGSDKTALALGDISGKGISAALLMASIQSSLRAQLAFQNGGGAGERRGGILSTAKLVSTLNRQLFENTTSEKFASFYYGIYDDQNGRLFYTNAGHLPPILIRNGKARRLEVTGMVIGAFLDVPYEEEFIQLEPGDLLTAFTDGITEPENEYGEEFGEQRLTDLLLLNVHKPLEELVTTIITAVNEWQNSPEQSDDMTLLLARRF